MKWLRLLTILLLPIAAQAATYYAAPNGTGTTCSFASPCDIFYALGSSQQAGHLTVVGDDVILLRGGDYTNVKINFTIAGTSGHPVTVKSYCSVLPEGCYGPTGNHSEWARIDGYWTTTLDGAINSSTTTVTIANAAHVGNNVYIYVDTEAIILGTQVGSTGVYTGCTRGTRGTTAASHSNGATGKFYGDVIASPVVSGGDYIIWRDFEVFASDPTRAYNSQVVADNKEPYRGEGFALYGLGNQIINVVVHDNREGVGLWTRAVGSLIYGLYSYNNGFVDTVRGHGHGIYTQNEDAPGKEIKNVLSLNNYATGMKAYAEAGPAENYLFERVVSFNNGSPAVYSGNPAGEATNFREPDISIGTQVQPAEDITVQYSVTYEEPDTVGGGLSMGIIANNVDGLVQFSNFYGGERGACGLGSWTSIVFANNVCSAENTGATNNDLVMGTTRLGAAFSGYDLHDNAYYDLTAVLTGCPTGAPNGRFGFFDANTAGTCNAGAHALSWTAWQGLASWESGSTYAASEPPADQDVYVNAYDTRIALVWAFNPSEVSTVAITISGYLSNGDSWYFYPGEAGTWPTGAAFQSGTVSGSTITLNTSGWSVATPIGSSFTSATVAPRWIAGYLFRVQSSSGGGGVSGSSKISGTTKQ